MKYITDYNPNWVEQFEYIASWLRERLPDNCHIHHVGSTSVFGMPAKNIIDIDIECPIGRMNTIITALNLAGYEHEGDKGISGREAFRPKEGTEASFLYPHHLYACESNARELHKHLAFRNFLLANPERARWLAKHKIECDNVAESRSDYIERKAPFYELITADSLKWAEKIT
ncbi:MAG: GrpB family protein [Chloroflexota bacterium]